MLSILRDRTRPLNRRLKEILTLSMDAQPLLDEDRGEELAAVAQDWQMKDVAGSGRRRGVSGCFALFGHAGSAGAGLAGAAAQV
ncbi:MAG: hypothetical protein V8R55_09045 [Dysosmobacter sp.]